jgi:LysR family transcriptional regulator for metE and metH
MELEVRHLRLVEAVAEHRSLTRAGRVLNLTQSALSHQLRDVEDRLGAALFLRLNRRMVLTPAGERLLDSAREVLPRLEQAELSIRDLARQGEAVLRLSTECYTCYHWLPSLLRRFHERHPRVDVRIDVDATSRPVAFLLERKIDLALVTSPVRHRSVVMRPLFRDELVVVVAPDHPLARRPYVRLSDLAQENLLTYSPRQDSHVYTRLLAPAGIVPAGFQEVRLTEAIVEMVKAHLGVSVMARWAVQPHLDAGTLAAVRLTARGQYRQWQAAVQKPLAEAAHVVEFLRLLGTYQSIWRSGD